MSLVKLNLYNLKLGQNFIVRHERNYFDAETTGLRPSEGHKVIEIAAIEVVDFIPTGKTYQQFINPKRDVPRYQQMFTV